MKRYLLSLFVFLLSLSVPLVLSSQKKPEPIPVAEETQDQEVVVAEVKDSFPDTEGHWAKTAIDALHNAGVVEGFEDGDFHPNEELTRAGAVKIAITAFGLDTSSMENSHSTFSDVSDQDWFKDYVVFANEIGIVKGYADNTFKPSASVTRAEALKIFLEAAGFIELDVPSDNFSDVDNVRDWFAKYSGFAKTAGLVSGYSDGTFQGNRTITRAEACVIVQKLIDYLAGQE